LRKRSTLKRSRELEAQRQLEREEDERQKALFKKEGPDTID